MSSNRNIWIVDDDPIARLLIKKTIERSGEYSGMLEIENGQVLLEKLQEQKSSNDFPEVILLDLNMPIMDGWEFLDRKRELGMNINGTQIIILTSSINPDDARKAREYPEVKGFIHKPLSVEDLKKLR